MSALRFRPPGLCIASCVPLGDSSAPTKLPKGNGPTRSTSRPDRSNQREATWHRFHRSCLVGQHTVVGDRKRQASSAKARTGESFADRDRLVQRTRQARIEPLRHENDPLIEKNRCPLGAYAAIDVPLSTRLDEPSSSDARWTSSGVTPYRNRRPSGRNCGRPLNLWPSSGETGHRRPPPLRQPGRSLPPRLEGRR